MNHRTFLTRLLNLVIVAALLIVYQGVATAHEKQEEIAQLNVEIEELEATVSAYEEAYSGDEEEESADGAFTDGTYTGTSAGYGGDITVEVVVEDGRIAEVNIVSADGEDQEYLDMAMQVAEDIVSEQSVEVDTVTGATLSSIGIRNAAILALQQAV